jgi:hypothetical protein
VDEHEREDRRGAPLSDSEERIARRAAQIVRDEMALQIGNSVIKVFIFAIGAVGVAAFSWLAGKEFFK